MAAQHPSYDAESVEDDAMMPEACGQPGEGTVAMDDMHKPRCRDSIPLGSRSPNTESNNNEKTDPEPLLAMKKKAAIASMPYENGGVTAIASSMSTSETQTATVPPQRPGYDVNDGVTSRKEPGSVRGGPLAADSSDHQMEGDDENSNGEQHQEHNGPQATQAVVMQRNLARPSASQPDAAEQRERSHERHGEDEPAITHDGVGVVVNLQRARQQARQWRTSHRVCRVENPPVTVEPCGHHIVCPRCFYGPYPGAVDPTCPVCYQPIEGYKFNQAMLDLFVHRSSKK